MVYIQYFPNTDSLAHYDFTVYDDVHEVHEDHHVRQCIKCKRHLLRGAVPQAACVPWQVFEERLIVQECVDECIADPHCHGFVTWQSECFYRGGPGETSATLLDKMYPRPGFTLYVIQGAHDAGASVRNTYILAVASVAVGVLLLCCCALSACCVWCKRCCCRKRAAAATDGDYKQMMGQFIEECTVAAKAAERAARKMKASSRLQWPPHSPTTLAAAPPRSIRSPSCIEDIKGCAFALALPPPPARATPAFRLGSELFAHAEEPHGPYGAATPHDGCRTPRMKLRDML